MEFAKSDAEITHLYIGGSCSIATDRQTDRPTDRIVVWVVNGGVPH